MALELGSHLGPYQVVAAIGEGGMGEVYSTCNRIGNDSIEATTLQKTTPAATSNPPIHTLSRRTA